MKKLLVILFATAIVLSGCSKKAALHSGRSASYSASRKTAHGTDSSSVSPSSGISAQDKAKSESLCGQADKYVQNYDFKNAEPLCDKAIALNPYNADAYNIKGLCLCYMKDYAGGTALIEKALKLKPDYPYALFNMAMDYKLQKNYDVALTWFNRVISVKPDDAWSYYGISTIYADRGDAQDSLGYLEKAIKLDPSVKQAAKTQSHYDGMRDNPDFQKLVD